MPDTPTPAAVAQTWWKRSAAPLAATVALMACVALSWVAFHQEGTCWGKGGGRALAELFAIALDALALLSLTASWAMAHLARSRTGVVGTWVLAALTVLLGILTVLLSQPLNCT